MRQLQRRGLWLAMVASSAIASLLPACSATSDAGTGDTGSLSDAGLTDLQPVTDAAGAADSATANDAATASSQRRYTPGHYVAISISQRKTAGGVPHPGVISDVGPVSTGVKGLVLRYAWNELEPTGGTNPDRFDWTRPDKEIAQCQALGVQLVMMIVVKTFDGTNPAPADLAGYATYFNTSPIPDGYMMWRWDATVLARFKQLVDAIGARYDANPNFAGIATQETSTSGVSNGGYTSAGYLTALKAESDYIAAASPSSRHFAYQNFIEGVTNAAGTALLADYAAHIQPNGAILGGPDLVMSGAILTRVYPNYTLYHDGTSPVPAAGPTFCSVQNAEWSGISPATPRSMQSLFDYGRGAIADDNGTKPLHLDIVVWDWHTTPEAGNGGQAFDPDATAIIAATQSFGTYSPP